MKQATNFAILVTTALYLSLGCLGYSAFGDKAPINLLNVGSSGEGFVNPGLLGGYQVGRSSQCLVTVWSIYIYQCVGIYVWTMSSNFGLEPSRATERHLRT